MTYIDHADEAQLIIAHTEGKDLNRSAVMITQAQVHATLALVEAQREANEIARIRAILTLPNTPENLRSFEDTGTPGEERVERVLKGLGL